MIASPQDSSGNNDEGPSSIGVPQQSKDVDLSLLELTEALIAAHKAARRNGDPFALKLVEAALQHAGARLAREMTNLRY